MSDCNHETIKCMQCHRYVGIHEQIIPANAAVLRIQELELEVKQLENELYVFKRITPAYVRKGWPAILLQGKQHELG